MSYFLYDFPMATVLRQIQCLINLIILFREISFYGYFSHSVRRNTTSLYYIHIYNIFENGYYFCVLAHASHGSDNILMKCILFLFFPPGCLKSK